MATDDHLIKNKRHYNDNFQLTLLLSVEILFNSIDYDKEKAKKKQIKRKQKTGAAQTETKIELARLQPMIDCQKSNLKHLRESNGIGINEKVIRLVLANANRQEDSVEELGSWVSLGPRTPRSPMRG